MTIMLKQLLSIFSFILLSSQGIFAQLQVQSTNQSNVTPYSLITNFMNNAGCNVISATYVGASLATGSFSGGSNAFGVNKGLLLTTGKAATDSLSFGADGVGADFANTDNTSDAQYAPLSELGYNLFDAAYYRVTFQPYNKKIRFKYVFASEEFPSFGCSQFSDVFAVFLEGPGFPVPTNITLIPDTDLPVSINNIHPAYQTCPALNEFYYNDNQFTDKAPTYDGYLDPFYAEATVQPCGTYTMTIIIADVGDATTDSGVFIEANSYGKMGKINASLSNTSKVLPEHSVGLPITLTFADLPPLELPVTIKFGGDATYGVDYQVSNSVFTVNSPDTVIHFTIHPIKDNLNETVESLQIKVKGALCLEKTYQLLLADPSTLYQSDDTLLLVGNTLTIGGEMTALSDKKWSFASTSPPISLVDGAGSTSNLTANILLPNLLFDNERLIESVCLNVTHPQADEIDVFLKAPNGALLELSTDNGGSGDNYTNTCFSAPANQSITASAAPFTGTFQPEGNWEDILGAPLNGIWSLYISDDDFGNSGTLDNWNVTFSGAGLEDFKYLWSTGATTKTINIQQAGVYTVTVTNSISTYTKKITVLKPCKSASKTFTICPNEAVTVNNVVYNAANSSGYQVFPISTGCDSVLFVQLQFITNLQSTQNATICAGSSYTFGNQILISSGTYQNTIPYLGCDSTISLQLQVLPSISTALNASICPGGSYTFGNQTIQSAGNYQRVLTASNGCDSTIFLQLQVVPPISTNQNASICTGGSYVFGNQTIQSAGNYQRVLTAANGCDSTIFLQLQVLPPISTNQNASICTGGSYVFGNQTIQAAGNYQRVLTAANGCDSTILLQLQVVPPISTNQNASICTGGSYVFGNQTIQSAGNYQRVLTAANGCDSTIILNLQVLPSIVSTQNLSICTGSVYAFGNQILQTTGTYSNVFTTINGCDSLVTLNLQVSNIISNTQNITICQGENFIFGNQTLTVSGVYQNLYNTPSGCDSSVILNLQVLAPISTTQTATICSGGAYTFGNQILTIGGNYQQLFQSISGCDSTVNLNLKVLPVFTNIINAVICQGDIYNFEGQLLETAGTYQRVLTSVNGCDSIQLLFLAVLPTITNTIDTTISFGETLVIGGNTFSQPGNYSITLMANNGCDSVLLIRIELISSVAQSSSNSKQVTIQPNPSSNEVFIRWTKNTQFNQLGVYGMDKKEVFFDRISPVDDYYKLDISNWPPGVYIVKLYAKGEVVVKKLIKISAF
jgi:hypothetical protein